MMPGSSSDRMTRGLDSLTIDLIQALGKVCAECPKKVLGKEGFADVLFVEPYLPSATLGKACVECFLGFDECFSHSAKKSIPIMM
jgi:hypothetical protein